MTPKRTTTGWVDNPLLWRENRCSETLLQNSNRNIAHRAQKPSQRLHASRTEVFRRASQFSSRIARVSSSNQTSSSHHTRKSSDSSTSEFITHLRAEVTEYFASEHYQPHASHVVNHRRLAIISKSTTHRAQQSEHLSRLWRGNQQSLAGHRFLTPHARKTSEYHPKNAEYITNENIDIQ